jgi:DegV family protein with EDD domain
MRIGVVVDASCDLPDSFFTDDKVEILPVTIRLGNETLVDQRDPVVTQNFYTSHISEGIDAETQAFSVEQIKDLFLGRLVKDFDYIFCITVTSKRSLIFENASRASFAILSGYRKIREDAGVAGPFALRVFDSKSMFCGTAVLAAEAVKLIREGVPANHIRQRLEDLTQNIVGYGIPRDLGYIRQRGIKKGEKSVGFATYLIGSALDIRPIIQMYHGETQPVAKVFHYEKAAERLFAFASQEMRQGIKTSHVCVCYGGPLDELRALPGYAEFEGVAALQGIEVLPALMSATACVNAGPGMLAMAWGGDLHEFK